MDDIEVPEYFMCPVSLQIMKDPVTAITGITYDRESIEHWLFNGKNPTCPVTKQALPRDSDLTPNHTLRRLIQAWCTENASLGVDRIPTPKPPLTKVHTLKLINNLALPHLQLKTLTQLELLAVEYERNRKCMLEAGVDKAIVSFILKCYTSGQILGLEEALSIMYLLRITKFEIKDILVETNKIVESLTWVLGFDDHLIDKHSAMKTHSVLLLKKIIKTASYSVLERLKLEFFERIIVLLRSKNTVSQQGINAALHILLDSCSCARNRIMVIEAGAVFELIELEIGSPEKRTTELILGVLFNLCSSADGRAQLLSHAGGLAVVSNRIFSVSTTANDCAVFILSLICRYSGNNNMVLQEMLKVGAISKLCMVLQSDSAGYLKDKARDVLKSHIDLWKKSPCIDVTVLAGVYE